MKYGAVDKILDSVLNPWAVSKGLQVAWPNVAFKPSSSMYLRVSRIPAPTDKSSIGEHGILVMIGIYQISIVSPKNPEVNSGTGPITQLADEISSTVFPVGSLHSVGDDSVQITNVSLGPQLEDESGWIATPLSITHRMTVNL